LLNLETTWVQPRSRQAGLEANAAARVLYVGAVAAAASFRQLILPEPVEAGRFARNDVSAGTPGTTRIYNLHSIPTSGNSPCWSPKRGLLLRRSQE